ncbi:FkbM family methyltransferase [Rhodoflexus caldus]|uniref:FkbM family methyltransferase n=1 Tax=Rhodoflexus caldus TaxID=2891236 RepID=UPI00202A7A76|nr:FkbM family methyltransferase [Rhodoflexus caldus]
MNAAENKLIYRRLSQKGFKPSHVAEVGVYLPETSNILDYIKQGIRTTLVEADPRYVAAIREYFGDKYPITLHPVAVFDSEGTIELMNRAASTFASILESSPALVNDAYKKQDADKFTVPAKRFDSLDDGTIDLLSIDIEGCEWYVLKHMISRPAVISVETHGKRYINPFINEITQWMEDNGYELWYKDSSDSVYIRRGLFPVTAADRRNLLFSEWLLAWKRFKANVKDALLGRNQ